MIIRSLKCFDIFTSFYRYFYHVGISASIIHFLLFSKQIRSFIVENHITVYPSTHRGRPVTKRNIQDYISNIVSKYLPVGLPPWQICVIPVIRTVSSAQPDDTTNVPSTSTESVSENETEEEQQQSSDTRTVSEAFVRLKFSHTEGHVPFDLFTRRC